MSRIRTIKPEFPQSESIGRLSRDARLLFIELWTLADDFGKARASSRMLASLLFPYDDDAPSLIDSWIAELEVGELIKLYEVDGSSYLIIVNWLKHQKIDRPTKSKLPDYEEKFAKIREGSREIREDQREIRGGPGPGKEGNNIDKSLTTLISSTSKPLTCVNGEARAKGKKELSAERRELIYAVTDAWNELAASCRLAQVEDITPKRQSAILARATDLVKTYDFPDADGGFRELFGRIRSSPFLRGEVNGFRATFDFAVTQSSFTKIMEGTYAAQKTTYHRR